MSSINRNFNHIIPREIDSEMKFYKFLSASDLIIGGAIVVLSFNLRFLVHDNLIIPYIIFIFLLAIFFIMPATKYNAEKKTYHILYFALSKKRKTYFSLPNPLEGGDTNVS